MMLLSQSRLQLPLFSRRFFSAFQASIYQATQANINPVKKQLAPLLGRFEGTTPSVDLFRIQNGTKVLLRDFAKQKAAGRASYDLHVAEDGLVHPKKGEYFEGPNRMSLRPNGPMLQEVVRNFRGANIRIYRLPANIPIPEDLVVLHEHSDHYSMQCNEPMKLSALNKKLTGFFEANAESMTKQEFVDRYPFESATFM